MHDGQWFGMGGMGLYWQIPLLIVVVLLVGWMFFRRRSGGGR